MEGSLPLTLEGITVDCGRASSLLTPATSKQGGETDTGAGDVLLGPVSQSW